MIFEEDLGKFLVQAKQLTYAGGQEAQKIIEDDGSKTLIFQDGDFRYHDNYFGGEPYGGRELVFFKGCPVYTMLYYGWVDKKITDFNQVYKILRQALLLIPVEAPYRGPKDYRVGDYHYLNSFTGELSNFSGEEIIKYKGEEIYKAKYIGGFLDQRAK